MTEANYEYALFTRYWDLTNDGIEVDRALEIVSEEWGLDLKQAKSDIYEVYGE